MNVIKVSRLYVRSVYRFARGLKQALAVGGVSGLGECVYCRLRRFQTSPQPKGESRKSAFDCKYGVDTDGVVPTYELETDGPNYIHGYNYQGCNPAFLGHAFARLNLSADQYCFVDLGSGKGRALLVASEYPFKAIIGVEYARALHEIAKSNIMTYKSGTQRCSEIRSVCADAAEFELPDGPLVVFMYNPFEAKLLREILEKLKLSYSLEPRDLKIIYLNTSVEIEKTFSKVELIQKCLHEPEPGNPRCFWAAYTFKKARCVRPA